MDNVEKVCEEVLPKSDNCFCKDSPYDCASCLANSQVDFDRDKLAQAIRQGKLIIPMEKKDA